MAGNPFELSIAPNINPMSGTGSDLHELTQMPEFGDVSVGGGSSSTSGQISNIAFDVLKAVLVALAVKVIYQKAFK